MSRFSANKVLGWSRRSLHRGQSTSNLESFILEKGSENRFVCGPSPSKDWKVVLEYLKCHRTYFYIAYYLSLQTDPLKGETCWRWTGFESQKFRNSEGMVPVTLWRINRRTKTSDTHTLGKCPASGQAATSLGSRSNDSSILLNSASCDGSSHRHSLSSSSSVMRPPHPLKMPGHLS